MLRSAITSTHKLRCLSTRKLKRSFISVPEIPYIDSAKSEGIKGLYSSKGLATAWYDNAEASLSTLEEVVNAAPNMSVLKGAVESSRSKGPEAQLEALVKGSVKTPDSYAVFNIASKVYNNYMSVSSLSPNDISEIRKPTSSFLLENPSTETEFPNSPKDYLESWIIDSFGSIVEFRTLLINSNLAIKGNGYTWLVARGLSKSDQLASSPSKYEKLYIVNTYNGGTPSFDHSSGQINSLKEQLNRANADQDSLESPKIARLPTVEEAKFQTTALDNSFYLPLLAINGSPYAYLPDYGVFGKKLYLDNVWNSIEWQAVTARLPKANERPKF